MVAADGWIRCGLGHRHWGRFGAVGLLACAEGRVLLIHRAGWSHHGGTWGPPGGARDSGEPPLAAALREAAEECDLPPDAVTITGLLLDDHGGWSYQTFVAGANEGGQRRGDKEGGTGRSAGGGGRVPVRAASPEVTEARWVEVAGVASLPLHPGFAEHWPVLREALAAVTVIVDGANVVGSRADGWWRDRAGAAQRLYAQLEALAQQGVASLPEALGLPPLTRWFPGFVLVVEGAARGAAFASGGRVRVVTAPGSGDDAIVAEAAALPGRRLVVTADRELGRRCQAAGAAVAGPRWLLGLMGGETR